MCAYYQSYLFTLLNVLASEIIHEIACSRSKQWIRRENIYKLCLLLGRFWTSV